MYRIFLKNSLFCNFLEEKRGPLAGNPSKLYNFSTSSSQSRTQASLGMRQSPRGESVTDPTLGPSGKQERLNCCAKKRQ